MGIGLPRLVVRIRSVALIGTLAAAVMVVAGSPSVSAQEGVLAKSLREVRQVSTPAGVRVLPSLSGGVLESAIEVKQAQQAQQAAGPSANAGKTPAISSSSLGITTRSLGCSARNSDRDVLP